MGLAAPRKRVKISHDPNNTTWAQSTSGFGHKIMTSQGWTPGSFLGARNASHADTFTKASASHIRVTLKDDTLGLGARPRNLGNDDVAALDAFQGLLGRLNGKSDTQLEEEQRKRDDTRLALYARTKWQTVTFVSGGYLVQEKPDDSAKNGRNNTSEISDDTTDASTDNDIDQSADATPSLQNEAKKVNKKDVDGKDEKKEKKKKREAKKEKEKEKRTKTQKEKKSKKEKKGKKEKKEKKEKEAEEEKEKKKKDSSKKRRRTDTDESSDLLTSIQQPTSLQRQTPTWRHSLRGRHIQQKKMAVMDDRSLGEIFMVKA